MEISIGVIAGSAFSCRATAGPDSWKEIELHAANPARLLGPSIWKEEASWNPKSP